MPARRAPKEAKKVDDTTAVLEALAEMGEADRAIGERLHAIITASVPDIAPRLWYGMPAWAKDGKVVCFFQSGEKFRTRYATVGFLQDAKLDDGEMWPVAFALQRLTPADEKRIEALVRRAAGQA